MTTDERRNKLNALITNAMKSKDRTGLFNMDGLLNSIIALFEPPTFTADEVRRLVAALPCKDENCGCGGYELAQKLKGYPVVEQPVEQGENAYERDWPDRRKGERRIRQLRHKLGDKNVTLKIADSHPAGRNQANETSPLRPRLNR